MSTIYLGWLIDRFRNYSYNYDTALCEIVLLNNYNIKFIYKKSILYLNIFNNLIQLLTNTNSLVINYHILNIKGLGYFINKIENNIIELHLGYSHKLYIKLPYNIKIEIYKDRMMVKLISLNKLVLNTIAFKLKVLRKFNKYKNIGIITF